MAIGAPRNGSTFQRSGFGVVSRLPSTSPTAAPSTSLPSASPSLAPSVIPTVSPTKFPTPTDSDVHHIISVAGEELYRDGRVFLELQVTTFTNLPWTLAIDGISGSAVKSTYSHRNVSANCPQGITGLSCQIWEIEFETVLGCNIESRDFVITYAATASGGSTGTYTQKISKDVDITLGSSSSWMCATNPGTFEITSDVFSKRRDTEYSQQHEILMDERFYMRFAFDSAQPILSARLAEFTITDPDDDSTICTNCTTIAALDYISTSTDPHGFEFNFFAASSQFDAGLVTMSFVFEFSMGSGAPKRRALVQFDSASASAGTSISVQVVEAGTCQQWCAPHPQSWSNKCQWFTDACSACPECGSSTTRSDDNPGAGETANQCEPFCQTNTQPWDVKCSAFAKCSGCSECAGASERSEPGSQSGATDTGESSGECKPFCEGNSQSWAVKCTFAQCTGCSSCDSTSNTQSASANNCPMWCSNSPQSWENKCATFAGCQQCEQCIAADAAEPCKAWCASSPRPWAEKCVDFAGCTGCQECD